jgi:hypothetical protein
VPGWAPEGGLLAEALRRPGHFQLVTRRGLVGQDYLLPGQDYLLWFPDGKSGWPLGVVPWQFCPCRERRHATYHRGRHWLCYSCVGRYDADPAAWEAARALPPAGGEVPF